MLSESADGSELSLRRGRSLCEQQPFPLIPGDGPQKVKCARGGKNLGLANKLHHVIFSLKQNIKSRTVP